MQTILITGAGSGIGRATARLFLESGWQVILTGRREEPLIQTADESPNSYVIPMDVSKPDEVDSTFGQVASKFQRLDLLFNNAGVNLPPMPIDETPVDDWLQLNSINITGMFLCARAAFGLMRKQYPQGGRIINNGSIAAYVPRMNTIPYTMSKHAITGLTRGLALDGRKFKIACGQIDIGNALTEMAERVTQGTPQADGSVETEPVMDVKHVADSVLHMASLPLNANVQFMTVLATNMPYIGRG